jgi:hypothetical protein
MSADDCALPDNLGPNIIETTVGGCTPGASLPSGESCMVQCAPGFEPINKLLNTTYTCSLGNFTNKPTLACKPGMCQTPRCRNRTLDSIGVFRP